MAVGIEDSGRRFIETDPIGKAGEGCEQKVWDAFKRAFGNRNCIGYWRYPIFSKTGETRKEPDVLMVDRELGIVIAEVKCLTIDQIAEVSGHLWSYRNFREASGSPYQQAEDQLYSLLSYCDRESEIRRQVRGRAMVALPLITEKEWQSKGFDRLPNCPPILFKDRLGEKTLLQQIEQTAPVQAGKNLDESQWELLLSVVGGTTVLRKEQTQPTVTHQKGKTRAEVINDVRQRLYELDLQQSHIGLEIPPGAQRIRGIAGSGKTVLLAQKAANMHLKHPDWDIALVFFTRSLYDQIEGLVDKWMRHFSCGDIGYKNNPRAQRKLRILHAWGAKDRDGFYRFICKHHRKPSLSVRDTEYKQPNEGLADICKRLQENLQDIEPMFDAVLIDEGQDLVVDPPALLHQERQAIYWLAYRSLRPMGEENPKDPNQKRLIWAYDEAQSLDAKTIPSAPNLFGKDAGFTSFVRGSHKGGIKKSEVMHRCYRTPGPILVAAHAIGMGLLRPGGMISGITRKEDWEAIGYEVKGDFRKKNETITLHRPPKNSPNPIPELWSEPVMQVNLYNSRREELAALAKNIEYNLKTDGLEPSRQILVVVLGENWDAGPLETEVAQFLMERGIKIFIPSATRLNQPKPQWPDIDRDAFWFEGGVTVSRIARAKGNEADMVYVVGLDNVAQNGDSIALRNQLFVAMTRARGWVTLSGTGYHPMYDELMRVMESGYTFEFVNNPDRKASRDMSDDDLLLTAGT